MSAADLLKEAVKLAKLRRISKEAQGRSDARQRTSKVSQDLLNSAEAADEEVKETAAAAKSGERGRGITGNLSLRAKSSSRSSWKSTDRWYKSPRP